MSEVTVIAPTNTLFELFVKAATEQFSEDHTRPGVVISFISDRGEDGEWYVCLNRFRAVGGSLTKEAVATAYDADLGAAINTCMKKFRKKVGIEPKANLKAFGEVAL